MKSSLLFLFWMSLTLISSAQDEVKMNLEEVQVTIGEKLELLPNVNFTLENRRVVGPFELFSEEGTEVTAKFRLVDIRAKHTDKSSSGYRLRIDYLCELNGESIKERSEFDFNAGEDWTFEESKTIQMNSSGGELPITIQFTGELLKK